MRSMVFQPSPFPSRVPWDEVNQVKDFFYGGLKLKVPRCCHFVVDKCTKLVESKAAHGPVQFGFLKNLVHVPPTDRFHVLDTCTYTGTCTCTCDIGQILVWYRVFICNINTINITTHSSLLFFNQKSTKS